MNPTLARYCGVNLIDLRRSDGAGPTRTRPGLPRLRPKRWRRPAARVARRL